ncbi:patatin-like phospholipase family protein [Sorangium sp. So ce1128]
MSDHDETAAFWGGCEGVPEGRVALVLTGAGARGAYEAGFVSRLLPELKHSRPKILVGTSAGAINAALLATLGHRTAEDVSREIVERWQRINKEIVLGSVWVSLLRAGIKYVASLLLGTDGPRSLLDTGPLLSNLKNQTLIDWDIINDNINEGEEPYVDVLAVATTESGSGRTKVFYQTRRDDLATVPPDDTRAIDYVRTELSAEHVLASAAIPVLFPPAWIGSPARGRYFVDGGLRLNAPLAPAMAFGANHIIVVSTDSRLYGSSAAVNIHHSPSMQDHILQIMRVITSDRMVEDVRVLLEQNRLLLKIAKETTEKGALREQNRVAIIFGGPSGQDDVGSVAARALEDILRGTRKLNHLDLSLLYWLTSVNPYSRPDVLSYVLFEPEFISAAIRAGIQDADELIEDNPTERELWTAMCRKHEKGVERAGGRR